MDGILHLVVHDGVDEDRDAVLGQDLENNLDLKLQYSLFFYLLWRDFKGHGPHVYLFIGVHTGDDEEDPRPPGSSCDQPAQSEDDGSLVLLDNMIIMTPHTTGFI